MFALQIFVQRNRKLLLRSGILALLGLGGLFAVLPRADARGAAPMVVASLEDRSILLSPEPLTDSLFSTLYPPAQR